MKDRRKHKKYYATSCIWQEVIKEYIRELILENKAKSTIDFRELVANRFVMYVESKGCSMPKQLTKELITSYEKDMAYKNPNTMRASQIKLRLFFRYLFRNESTSFPYELIVNTRYKVPQKVITVISDEQKKELQSKKGINNATLNRTYAICTLALYLGLRKTDISNLKFSDIDWKNNTITILQQKTLVTVQLPLIPAVGNALIDYIVNHRPETKCLYVFVSHIKPYVKLKKQSNLHKLLPKLITFKNPSQSKGLHQFRRAASINMLKSSVDIRTTAGFLGHTSLASIGPYLSIEDKKLKECTHDMDTIGIPKEFNI